MKPKKYIWHPWHRRVDFQIQLKWNFQSKQATQLSIQALNYSICEDRVSAAVLENIEVGQLNWFIFLLIFDLSTDKYKRHRKIHRPVCENIEVARQQVSLLGNFSAISAHRSHSYKQTNMHTDKYTNIQHTNTKIRKTLQHSLLKIYSQLNTSGAIGNLCQCWIAKM